jgi:type IV secretory pathway VirB10-like protein
LKLTPDQQRAARACGFAFFPATDEQVRRLTMQKRVFRIDDQPYLATRDGGYWETHGTLTQVIDDWVWHQSEPVIAEPERPTQPEEASVRDTEPMLPTQDAEPTDPVAASPEETIRTPARAARRRSSARPTSRRKGEGAAESAEAAATDDAAASTSASEVVPEAQADSAPEKSVVRRSRVRQPKAPRWVTAGKERRGRLK